MFRDRRTAGELLGAHLRRIRNPVIIGIARGGVIVAGAVGLVLQAPLDLLVIRKVGHPLQPELALGAVSASGQSAVTPYAAEFPADMRAKLFAAQIERAKALESALRRRPPIDLQNKTAVLVDDGIATSATMACAIEHARAAGAAAIVCAAPVAPADSVVALAGLCDEVLVVQTSRERDFAVGRFYADFREIGDDEVRQALEAAAQGGPVEESPEE
jgi:putative phosphoribosyl transferase